MPIFVGTQTKTTRPKAGQPSQKIGWPSEMVTTGRPWLSIAPTYVVKVGSIFMFIRKPLVELWEICFRQVRPTIRPTLTKVGHSWLNVGNVCLANSRYPQSHRGPEMDFCRLICLQGKFLNRLQLFSEILSIKFLTSAMKPIFLFVSCV